MGGGFYVNELCHALSIEIGSPNLDTDSIPSIGLLPACFQGLVTVDNETSIVRLTHFTVQEYLRAHPGLFGSAHSTMAETWLGYLNSHQVKALPGGLVAIPIIEISIPKAHYFLNILLSIGKCMHKGSFPTMRNCSHLSYLTTAITTYPPKSS